ncbi:helix-turn-helix domain-containing protein [Peribacillus alkalitolerans]|uniref:helix-turn-helix domain-containing protein n=1 Tax=Peribacillus alkalitolerans TaxID=1550385 RepID=UPI0013D2F26D|nr:helix-turn-helix transcriptional regulator [Peribacillus alkalitolerans]
MYEGKIIKFYREKYKLTQEQLGRDICSTTHISKIECNQTTYNNEIITLLSDRLGINMDLEIKKFINIKHRLSQWHDSIIMQLEEEVEQINSELECEELVNISDYTHLYQLLRSRYFLIHKNTCKAFKIIKKIRKIEHELTDYESNLLKHVLGIYYLAKQDYINAIQTLKRIQNEIYNNQEYYYHMAIAYHTLQSPVLAYYFSEKSRQFFKALNNYLRVIDAEMLMIIQVKDNDSDEIINRFKNLIKSCDLCHAPERKAKVLHNLAFEYYRRKNYDQAILCYKESMSLKIQESPAYLLSLEGFIRSSFDGELIDSDNLIRLAEDGLIIAIRINQLLYIHLFKLILYLLKSKEKEYHQYLANKALPTFVKCGVAFFIQRSKKELFNYYSRMNFQEKALEMAKLLFDT